jgi:flagellar hook-associated protein 2
MSTSGLNLSSLGLTSSTATSGSGIDVTSVVNQIINSARGPEQIWQQQQSESQSESSALSSMNTSLTTLSDKVTALNDFFGVLAAKTATSSQPSILTASTSSSAAAGNHLIVVSNLASTGTAYSDARSDANTTFATGKISLQVGSASHDIQIDDTNDTLSGLASYINQQNFGVTASVVTDVSGSRLALVSNATGTSGDLSISANTSGLNINKGATGKNAALTVDGVPFSSATNTVTGAIPGVTLSLLGASAGTEVQLTVGPDQASAAQAVTDFVNAYNSVITAINKGTAFDSSTNQAGALSGDSSVRLLQSHLLSNAAHAVSGAGGLVNLGSMGVTMNDDGTLTVDSSKLNDVVTTDYPDFQNFFQSASSGFATNFAKDLTSLTDPTKGVLNLDLTQHTSEQKALTDQINDFEAQLAVRQQQLTTQYSQVDAELRQFPMIMQQITSQLDSLSSGK